MGARYLLAGLIAVCGCSFDIAAEPVSDVEVTWQITMAGAEIRCTAVDASTVRVTFDAPAGHRFADWFPCDDGYGVSPLLPVDDYTVTASVLANDGIELSQTPAVAVEVSEDDAMILPQFRFYFDASRPYELGL